MEQIIWAIEGLSPSSIIDILLVALVLFGLSFLVRGAQGVTLLRGFIIVYAVAVIVSNVLNLTAMRWLLQNLITLMAVAIPVIFQPELRRALERLGRAGAFSARTTPDEGRAYLIETVAQAAERLSERRHGALIVLERGVRLERQPALRPVHGSATWWPPARLRHRTRQSRHRPAVRQDSVKAGAGLSGR